MDYYKDLLNKIENFCNNHQYQEAIRTIDNELSMPYVPSDIENKLLQIKKEIDIEDKAKKFYDDEDIINFLAGDKTHQLTAVDTLNSRNLRNYIDVIDDYLKGNGFVNAKVLLIDSLVNQQVDYIFVVNKDDNLIEFNPIRIEPVYTSKQFSDGVNYLEHTYMKEPSKLILAKKLLSESMILNYPLVYSNEELKKIVNEIIEEIDKAFDSAL